VHPEKPAVLVVDDEPAIGRILGLLVNSLGCETVVTTSAEEALDRIPDMEPCMMFVDVRLPGIDGVEFVERVRRTRV
jgi:two-component system OmpR family response regulator